MSELKQDLQLLEVRRIMRYQLALLVSTIFLGAVIWGIQTENLFTSIKIAITLLLCVTFFAPLVYSRAKQRLEAFNNSQ